MKASPGVLGEGALSCAKVRGNQPESHQHPTVLCRASTARLVVWLTLLVAAATLVLKPTLCLGACWDPWEIVSVSSTGELSNAFSARPSVSADGRFVAFQSLATNLVPGDTNAVPGNQWRGADVFVRDRLLGVTERISVSSSGEQSNDSSSWPTISADGRFVAFESAASNLVASDTNDVADVFLRDRMSATTERVSVSMSGEQGNGESYFPTINAQGRFLAFTSLASNLVAADTNNASDAFVRDLVARTTERVGVSSDGAESTEGSGGGAISANGRFVAFESDAANLVPNDTNGLRDIFVHDRETGETTRVNVTSDGTQADGWCGQSAISGDGRYVAFWASATSLSPPRAGLDFFGLYLHDRATGDTIPVPLGSHYQQSYPALSADGRYLAFDHYWWVQGGDRAGVAIYDTHTGQSTDIVYSALDPALSADGRFLAVVGGATPTFLIGLLDRLPDCIQPDTEITAGPCGQTAACASASVSWRGSDPPVAGRVGPVAFAWRLDAGAWSPWTTDTGTTLTGLSDGAHVFEVKARDLTGNEESTPARCEFTVVLSPPTVSITSPANGATVRGTITITATVSQGAGLTASAKTIPSASSSPLRGGGLRWGASPVWHSRPRLCSDGQAGAPVPHTDMPAAGTAALQADGIECVEFYVNGQLLCTDTEPPYTCQWDTIGRRGGPPWPPLPPTAAAFGQARGPAPTNGPAQICAKAFDRCGRSAQQCITVNVRNQTFEDVPPDNPAFDAIEAIAARGITSGCLPTQGSADLPLFCPYASATKAQVAVFICKAAGKTWLDRPTPTFADVPRTHWAYGYIERFCDAASWGGTAPGTPCAIFGGKKFCPTASVSRQEIAAMLCRATGKAPLDRAAPTFADVPNTNPYRGWIERLADPASWPGGIAVTNGCACPSTYPQPAKCYCPKSPLTRAQLAVFLVRAFGIPLHMPPSAFLCWGRFQTCSCTGWPPRAAPTRACPACLNAALGSQRRMLLNLGTNAGLVATRGGPWWRAGPWGLRLPPTPPPVPRQGF